MIYVLLKTELIIYHNPKVLEGVQNIKFLIPEFGYLGFINNDC